MLSKPYFKNSLIKLSKKNFENANIICEYIYAEQTELNIKNSTKEGKIKILVWLSNHFQDQKFFRDMTKFDILDFLNKLRKSYAEPSDLKPNMKAPFEMYLDEEIANDIGSYDVTITWRHSGEIEEYSNVYELSQQIQQQSSELKEEE